jgi:hypothetical protein
MEAGHLDFYRHKETCTMRCLSRAATLPRPELNVHLTAVGSINETTFNTLENDALNFHGQPMISNIHGAMIMKPSPKPRTIPLSLVAATTGSGRSTPELTQTVFINTNQGTIAKTAAANSLLRLNMADLKAGVVAKENGSDDSVMSFLTTFDNGASNNGAESFSTKNQSDVNVADHDLDVDELSMFEHCHGKKNHHCFNKTS